MDTVKVRAREVGGRYYQTLLNSLTLDQLRSALLRLKARNAPAVRTRGEVIDAIESAGWVENELVRTLLDIESKSPTRHAAISKYEGPLPDFSGAVLFEDLPVGPDGLAFRPVYVRKTDDYLSVTFEHIVEVREWRTDGDEDRQQRVTTRIRHPIIVRFYSDMSIAGFFFPGFTLGTASTKKDRRSYEDVVGALSASLSYQYKTSFRQFPILSAVKYLQAGDSPEVRVIRTDIEAVSGKVSLDAPSQANSVNELLLSFLQPHVAEGIVDDLRKAIKKAINDAYADQFVIYWCKERVVTRIKLWGFACELMFIWNDTESSFRSIDAIIRLLVGVAQHTDDPSERRVWDFVVSLDRGAVVQLNELVARGAQSKDAALDIALQAVEAGVLEYVFRLNTSALLVDAANVWSSNSAFYRRPFRTVDGDVIDGTDPKMVEVGFKKARSGEGAAQ